MSQKFCPEMKIRQASDFKKILKKGRKHRNQFVNLHVLFIGKGKSRLGVIASRKTGSAVIRNRSKRLLREAFRLLYPNLPNGLEFVAVAKPSIAFVGLDEVEEAFLEAAFPKNR